jgi:transcriptional regulator with XRE-family HTH domain
MTEREWKEQQEGESLRTFGDRMRLQREVRAWTQTELAKRAGVDVGWISRLERGERQNISLAAARRIARALNVGLDYLAQTFGGPDGEAADADSDGSLGCVGLTRYP